VEAVVTALELDDLLAPGDPAREPDRVIRGLRAAVADDDLLGGRDVAHDRAGECDLRLGDADAEQHGVAHGAAHAVDDRRVRVAEEDRAIRGVVVDVAAAVEVLDVCALAAPDADARLTASPAGIDPAGDHRGGIVQQQL
jgi:hypothetical protein